MRPDICPSAVNVHEIFTYLATSTPEGMQELKTKFADAFGAAGLSGKETAVIYEQSMNSGFGQSCRGYYLLTMLGYPKVKVLHGGIDAWAAAGLPVTKDVPKPVKAGFSIVPEAGDILIDAKTMLGARRQARHRASSTSAMSMNGSATAPRLTARISVRARDASPARSGSNGIA